jgi:hypothetical protein
MSKNILSFMILFAAIFSTTAFTQTQEEKQSNLIEGLVTDISGLKLPENRAFAYAKLGAIVWKTDQKRSRVFFQNAASELINLQIAIETRKKKQHYGYGNEDYLRQQVLRTIAAKDAEFALEAMVKTRPAKITKSLAAPKNSEQANAEVTVGARGIVSINDSYLAEGEIALEQEFLYLAAEQKPDKALELLRQGLKKGLSYQTFSLLMKVFEKEPETANSLANEILQKIANADFSTDNQVYSVSTQFLQEFSREKTPNQKTINLDEGLIKKIAGKCLDKIVKQNNSYNLRSYLGSYYLNGLKVYEKILPERVREIRQKSADKNQIDIESEQEKYNKLIKTEPTAEVLLAEAKNYKSYIRQQIYQNAAGKIAKSGNIEQAREVLTENLPEENRAGYLSSLNQQLVSDAINSGNFSEAERLIEILPESMQISSLINLANVVYQKKPDENKQTAVNILERAVAIVSENPDTHQDTANLLIVVSTMAEFDSKRAFNLTNGITFKMNEIIEAKAKVDRFYGGNVIDSEFPIHQNSLNLYSFSGVFGTLAGKDAEQTLKIIELFQAPEIRVLFKLELFERYPEILETQKAKK